MGTNNKIKDILYLVILVTVVALTCVVNRYYYKNNSTSHDVSSDTQTVLIYDTLIHHIKDTVPFYDYKTDTIVYNDTITVSDTAEALRDYFAKHVYIRHWKDSLVDINLTDVISMNKLIKNELSYKILRPTTVNNIVNNYYSKYLYVGISLNNESLKRIGVEALYGNKNFAVGIGYEPFENNFAIKGYKNILKLK